MLWNTLWGIAVDAVKYLVGHAAEVAMTTPQLPPRKWKLSVGVRPCTS
jgi:hypothetical protein